MHTPAWGDGSRRHPLGHASTLAIPPAHEPSELPSFEHVGCVSPANSPQPPASVPPASPWLPELPLLPPLLVVPPSLPPEPLLAPLDPLLPA
jgi:hypothetical protein